VFAVWTSSELPVGIKCRPVVGPDRGNAAQGDHLHRAHIGDRRVLDDGTRIAAVKLDLKSASPETDLSAPVFIDLGHLDPAPVTASVVGLDGPASEFNVLEGLRNGRARRIFRLRTSRRRSPGIASCARCG